MDMKQISEELRVMGMQVKEHAALSEYTTFRIGGPADLLLVPESAAQLQAAMQVLREKHVPVLVLGNGSNVLVRDSGVRGAVVILSKKLGGITVDAEAATVKAGAGALMSETAHAAAEAGLTGMEFASGIPGSVGGGVFMNAGAYGGEMAQIAVRAVALLPDGTVRTFEKEELDFGYRHSCFYENGGIILEGEFQLQPGIKSEISETMKELNRRRMEKQPLNYPSAGSVFKRPEGYFAGKLIQDAGCKGLSVGGAMVSPKHAGFIVNRGGATAQDVLDLIALIQLRVKEQFGVNMETEVRVIGHETDGR